METPESPESAPAGEATRAGASRDAPARSAPASLAGVRVADFSQNLAGPYATQILGDLGANVVKVEPPGGDPARRWGPPFVAGQSALFQAANRNKRSVVLDLKTPAGRGRAQELAAGADVVVQALRLGVAARLGIGYESVRRANPAVVYVSETSHGPDGPLREDPGYDPLLQARSGLMSVTGEAGGRPVRVGASVVDLGTGMWVALAVTSALMERARTGRGRHVEASLLDTALAWMSYHLTSFLATGADPQPQGTAIAMIAPYQAFPCVDGEVMIAAGTDAIFRRLCTALELGLASDPRYSDNAGRVARREPLAALLSERTRRLPAEALLDLLREHGVPSAPIHTVASALADPQTVATDMLRSCAHPLAEDYVDVPMPLRWDGNRAPLRRVPPEAGQHQDEVFPAGGGVRWENGDRRANERVGARTPGAESC